jgi:crotonobetainyl-CoA:carnitine CoA-transferase CaiB-like acyl-CoA transferase
VTDPELPLAGLRVLDLTRNVAGPYATMVLADLGAEVLKVERPDAGDDTRRWGPPFWGTQSPIFLTLNRNKRGLPLDLRRPEAAGRLREEVARSDVLVESFRAGWLEEMGFGYEWASGVNPRLIYCSITGFGDVGPMRSRPGYDPIVQAFAGLMSVTGEEGRPPVRVGTSIIDMGTGMWAAMAVQSALLRRERTGRGGRVSVSLYETGLAWMAYQIANAWASGEPPGRLGSGMATIAPYEGFACRDGHVMIGAGNDRLFRRLAEALGHPGWADDLRFCSNPLRVANRAALHDAIESVTAGLARQPLLDRLAAAGVPAAAVRDVGEVCADEQAEALGMFVPLPVAAIPELRLVALPVSFDGRRPPIRTAPPGL